jgi:peroxiredoxin
MADYQLSEDSLEIGALAPDFYLKGVEGDMHSLASYKDSVLVIAAVCNHCPYVQAYLDRMIDLQERYLDRGVKMIGINSNDVSRYPDDSFEKMAEMAEKRGFNFDYLRDDDQSVAQAYLFERTPQFLVFDQERRLRYTGGLDDGCRDVSQVTERPLEDAIVALLEGREVARPEAPSIGCSVKWVE